MQLYASQNVASTEFLKEHTINKGKKHSRPERWRLCGAYALQLPLNSRTERFDENASGC